MNSTWNCGLCASANSDNRHACEKCETPRTSTQMNGVQAISTATISRVSDAAPVVRVPEEEVFVSSGDYLEIGTLINQGVLPYSQAHHGLNDASSKATPYLSHISTSPPAAFQSRRSSGANTKLFDAPVLQLDYFGSPDEVLSSKRNSKKNESAPVKALYAPLTWRQKTSLFFSSSSSIKSKLESQKSTLISSIQHYKDSILEMHRLLHFADEELNNVCDQLRRFMELQRLAVVQTVQHLQTVWFEHRIALNCLALNLLNGRLADVCATLDDQLTLSALPPQTLEYLLEKPATIVNSHYRLVAKSQEVETARVALTEARNNYQKLTLELQMTDFQVCMFVACINVCLHVSR
jgi:hypothetical protein